MPVNFSSSKYKTSQIKHTNITYNKYNITIIPPTVMPKGGRSQKNQPRLLVLAMRHLTQNNLLACFVLHH